MTLWAHRTQGGKQYARVARRYAAGGCSSPTLQRPKRIYRSARLLSIRNNTFRARTDSVSYSTCRNRSWAASHHRGVVEAVSTMWGNARGWLAASLPCNIVFRSSKRDGLGDFGFPISNSSPLRGFKPVQRDWPVGSPGSKTPLVSGWRFQDSYGMACA